MDASELVGLNPEAVRTTATVHGGYAHALERREREPVERGWRESEIAMVHASSLLRAASFLAIVDQDGARRLFREAALAYAKLRRPFSVLLAICSGFQDVAMKIADSVLQKADGTDPTEPLVRLFAGALLDRNIGEWQPPHEFAPVGRLRIPFGTYNALLNDARDEPARAVSRYLARVTEPFMAASADKYHWQRHYRAVLPLEPEVMAPLIGLAWHQRLRLDDVREIYRPRMARAIAEVSLALAGTQDFHRETHHE